MRILICQKAGRAFGYITDGWINCLKERHHTVERWDGKYETWDQFDPDLYIGSAGHKQPIPTKRRAKVALHVNSWGPISIDTSNESNENISESPDNIQWVIERKPDIVFGYGFYKDRHFWAYWTEKANIPWVPMPTAGDKTLYYNQNLKKEYDIVYLGGRWPYKSETLDVYLLPVLRLQPNHKVYGWGQWPKGVCEGELSQNQAPAFLASGRVGPCVSEKHTLVHGIDVPERVFKVALSGTLAIHDPIPGFDKVFPDVILADNPQDYANKCYYYTKNDTVRDTLIKKQQNYVLNNHTYHHRLYVLLKSLGFMEEAQAMLL